jgi:type II secretory pathway pseudopilin PulG
VQACFSNLNVDNKKSAFTLIELLVYMAILGFVIVVAGRVFSDSTSMRVRSQNMLASAEEGGRVSALLKEDISQMGTKSWVRSSSSGQAFKTADKVYLGLTDTPKDSSSYILTKPVAGFDSIYFRKAFYSNDGDCRAIMGISWYVRDSTLMRKCVTIADTECTGTGGTITAAECPDTVEMSRNVAEFRLLPSTPGRPASASAASQDFPSSGSTSFNITSVTEGNVIAGHVAGSGSKYTLSGFRINSSSSTNPLHSEFYLAAANETNCKQFTFEKGEIYSIEFFLKCESDKCVDINATPLEEYNKMVMFQPGKDHLSVGLRDPAKKDGARINPAIPDFLFYPPQGTEANKVRHFDFSVPQNTTACVGITAAFYSNANEGHLDLENFRVYKKTENVYHFNHSSSSNNPVPPNKASVKAFELTLGITKKREINRTITVIPVPNNGSKQVEVTQ